MRYPQLNCLFTSTIPLCRPPNIYCCTSLDPTTKDDALGFSVDLGQPGDVLAPTGPSRARVSTVPLLVCLETSCFCHASTLLVILWLFARKPLRSSPRKCDILAAFLVHGGPDDLALAGVRSGIDSASTVN